jgi:hypothetical protein
MSRLGCSLPANASGVDPHRASITSRLGQVVSGRRRVGDVTLSEHRELCAEHLLLHSATINLGASDWLAVPQPLAFAAELRPP